MECDEHLIFECHVIRIPLDMERVVPEFVQAFSSTDYFRRQMMDKSKTATMTTIGQKDIVTSSIYVPPMKLQREFVLFAHLSDKSKTANYRSLMKIDLWRNAECIFIPDVYKATSVS